MNACGYGDRASIDKGDGFLSPYSARGSKRVLAVLLSAGMLVAPLLLPRQGESAAHEVVMARPAAGAPPLAARLVNDERYVAPTTAPPPTVLASATRPVPKKLAAKVVRTKATAAPVRKPSSNRATAAQAAASNPIEGNSQSGHASWYDAPSGTCAHRSLPKGTVVTVTAAETGRQVTCTVADRGPYIRGRIIDLAKDGFEALAPISTGVIAVRLEW